MKIIYVVTDGEYSDYRICGVFNDKGLANIFRDTFGGEVEEYGLNPCKVELKKGYLPYFVRMSKDGNTLQVNPDNSSYGFTRGNSYGFDAKDNLYYHLMAKSVDHAIKITNERRTGLIASNQWGVILPD